MWNVVYVQRHCPRKVDEGFLGHVLGGVVFAGGPHVRLRPCPRLLPKE